MSASKDLAGPVAADFMLPCPPACLPILPQPTDADDHAI